MSGIRQTNLFYLSKVSNIDQTTILNPISSVKLIKQRRRHAADLAMVI